MSKTNYCDTAETRITDKVHSVRGVRLLAADGTVYRVECRSYEGCRPPAWFFDGVAVSKADAQSKAAAIVASGATQESL